MHSQDAHGERDGTAPPASSSASAPCPRPVRLTDAEVIASHQRYLRALKFKGAMPDCPNYGDYLLERLNRGGR